MVKLTDASVKLCYLVSAVSMRHGKNQLSFDSTNWDCSTRIQVICARFSKDGCGGVWHLNTCSNMPMAYFKLLVDEPMDRRSCKFARSDCGIQCRHMVIPHNDGLYWGRYIVIYSFNEYRAVAYFLSQPRLIISLAR